MVTAPLMIDLKVDMNVILDSKYDFGGYGFQASARCLPFSPQVTANSAQAQGSATEETRRRKAPGKVATVAR